MSLAEMRKELKQLRKIHVLPVSRMKKTDVFAELERMRSAKAPEVEVKEKKEPTPKKVEKVEKKEKAEKKEKSEPKEKKSEPKEKKEKAEKKEKTEPKEKKSKKEDVAEEPVSAKYSKAKNDGETLPMPVKKAKKSE